MQPYRWQPTRLPHPWDSPGKNAAVGCHFLLQCMKVKSESEVAQSCPTLSDPMDCSLPGSSVLGIFQARVLEWYLITYHPTGVGCHCLLQYTLGISAKQKKYSPHKDWTPASNQLDPWLEGDLPQLNHMAKQKEENIIQSLEVSDVFHTRCLKWSEVKCSVVSDSLQPTPWTVAYQAPPSMGFSRHEYWSGFPFPSPGDLPDPGIEPRSPAL